MRLCERSADASPPATASGWSSYWPLSRRSSVPITGNTNCGPNRRASHARARLRQSGRSRPGLAPTRSSCLRQNSACASSTAARRRLPRRPRLVEAGAGHVVFAVVVDRDLVDFAQIDALPDRIRIVVGVNDFQIPFAGLGFRAEVDIGELAILEHVLAKDVIPPALGLARRDEQRLQLVAGAVDQRAILLGGLDKRMRGNGDNSGGRRGTQQATHDPPVL